MADIIDLGVYAVAMVVAGFVGRFWSLLLLLRGFFLRESVSSLLGRGLSLIADFSAWLPVIYIVLGLFSGGALSRMAALLGIPFIIGFLPMAMSIYFKMGGKSS